jgi:hypothetical protein
MRQRARPRRRRRPRRRAQAAGKKYKIYWNLSLTSGGWIAAATNAVKALAATPPYDQMVDLQIVISVSTRRSRSRTSRA